MELGTAIYIAIVLFIIILFYVIYLLSIFFFQFIAGKLIFPYSSIEVPLPKNIKSKRDSTYNTLILYTGETKKKAILYCHGNFGNVTYHAESLNRYLHKDYDVYTIDYLGYLTPCKNIINDFYKPGVSLYNELYEKYNGNVVLVGESIGVSVICHMLSEIETNKMPKRILCINGFTKISGIFPAFPLFDSILSLMKCNLNNEKLLQLTKDKCKNTEMIFVSAKDDKMIPPHCCKQLSNVIPGAYYYDIEGSHNSYDFEKVLEILHTIYR